MAFSYTLVEKFWFSLGMASLDRSSAAADRHSVCIFHGV
jgi:hypothetical protein